MPKDASKKSAKVGRPRAPVGGRQTAKGAGALREAEGEERIRFTAKILTPRGERAASWTFLNLPKEASAKMPSRAMVSVEGTLNGARLHASLEPDGKGGHWLRVDRRLREAAGAEPGDVVTVELAPSAADPEPELPPDWRKALAGDFPGAAKAREVWSDITPAARRDWIHWMTSGKRAETRVKRIETACDMLAKGKRRPCCFDRSGMYSQSLSCPVADDE